MAPSSIVGGIGLELSAAEGILKSQVNKASSLAQKAEVLGGVKIAVVAGKTLGVVGAALTAFEGALDRDGLTWGDGARVAIGLATTFTPAGWIYGVLDLGIGMATGTTLTDRIGTLVDEEIRKQ
jgi:hypothetical protein